MTHCDPTVPVVLVGHGGSHAGHQTPSSQMDHHSINGGDSSENTPVSSKLGKMMSVKVLMLDDSITVFQVQVSDLISRGKKGQFCRLPTLPKVQTFAAKYHLKRVKRKYQSIALLMQFFRLIYLFYIARKKDQPTLLLLPISLSKQKCLQCAAEVLFRAVTILPGGGSVEVLSATHCFLPTRL